MYFFEKNNLKMSGLYIVYNAGSIYEDSDKNGTMHLMEHLICKSFDDMQDELTKRNVTYNAYTSDEIVLVHFTGLHTELNSELKTRIVNRLINGVFVSEDDFNKEKDIVLQEYYDFFNDIMCAKIANKLRRAYNSYSIIGSADDIKNFTYESALSIFNTYFKNPSNIIEVGRESTDFSFVEYNNIEYNSKPFKYGKYNTIDEIVPESETGSVVMSLITKPIAKKDYPYISILVNILSDGLNSPLYQELREKRGLVYAILPYCIKAINQGLVIYVAMTSKENALEVSDIMETVLKNMDKFITKERFDDVISNMSIQMDINKIFQYKEPKSLSYGLIPTTFKSKKQLKSITLEKILEIGKKYFSKLDTEIL